MGSSGATRQLKWEHAQIAVHRYLSFLLALLMPLLVSNNGASAKSQGITIRFSGYVPTSCPKQDSYQPITSATAKQKGSFQYMSQDMTGEHQQMTCVFY